MGTFIGLCVVVAFLFAIVQGFRKASLPNQTLQARDRLQATGLPARGLVLTCSQYGTGITMNQRRFEKRTMTIDVEIPGRQPYVSRGDFLIPRGVVEAIPGASLDLVVDAADPDKIVVLGPGGFTGPWLRLGPPQSF